MYDLLLLLFWPCSAHSSCKVPNFPLLSLPEKQLHRLSLWRDLHIISEPEQGAKVGKSSWPALKTSIWLEESNWLPGSRLGVRLISVALHGLVAKSTREIGCLLDAGCLSHATSLI